jgi:cell division protein FtsW (lipid II flippase)/cell division protein FtsI/penicillin-binding protein 2
MTQRRTTELLLLLAGAIPVFLLYALYVLQSGEALSATTLIVPIGLAAAFVVAHIAVRVTAPNADSAILPIVFVLAGIGITFVTRLAPDLAVKQVVWLFISIAAMIAVLVFVRRLDSLARYKYSLGAIGLILLVLPIFIGTEHYGSKLWIEIPGVASFQPGEIAKVLIVIFLASFLSENRELMSVAVHRVGPLSIPRLRMLLPMLAVWLISLAIVVWERDLGSAVLFFAVFVVMLYAATGRWFYPIVSLFLLGIGAVLSYMCFAHVRNRVQIWLDPFCDPSNASYQIAQSLYSIADGNLLGTGIGQGMSTMIPIVESDFIFSAIAEELGLLGAAAVILLFVLLAVRGLLTAARARSDLSAFMAVGLTASIGIQAFLIIGGVTGLIPLTGVTLPFMSQGGSSLLSSFIAIGLLLRCGHEGTGDQTEVEGTGVSGKVFGSHLETPESGVLGRIALSRRLTVLTGFFSIIDAALIARLAYLQVFKADEIRNMSSNNHTLAKASKVQRGSILTSDGVTLAESVLDESGTYTRSYPQGSMAAHTVGYYSTVYGTTGIESTCNDVLAGKQSYTTWSDLLNSFLGTTQTGGDVMLTINSRIQQAAEEVLQGRVGGVVVMEPSTGAILAKASSPTYTFDQLPDLLAGTADTQDAPLYDRTTQALYTPGSTFKTITLAAVLQTGAMTLDTTVSAPASLEIGGGTITNHNDEELGDITLQEAFAYSSNTAFAQVATLIGADTLVSEAKSFGYGSELGADFSCTASLMPDPSEMTEWETGWAGAGQPVGEHTSPAGPQTTIVQNALVACAIANKGVLMEPHVIKATTDSTGTVLDATRTRALGQACSEEVAQLVGSAMLTTVEEGTGTAASIAGVNVAGKTGTAETNGANPNAWFIGYAPYENPVAAIAIVVENDAEHTATSLAGDVLQVAVETLGGN